MLEIILPLCVALCLAFSLHPLRMDFPILDKDCRLPPDAAVIDLDVRLAPAAAVIN